jgi:tetratricopeptide (TPR) repeat protein/transcriptional regulator with XRE-family HTH domain
MDGGALPTFGTLLRHHRLARGLTQEALAERAQVSAFTISALERGVSHRPHIDTLDLLATALALSMQDRAALAAAVGRLASAAPASAAAPYPLVGRVRELALLEAHLAGEGPPVLLLTGQPGIGKSRLLAEAARHAQVAGWQVLAGGCQRRGGQQPSAPLLEAIERHLHWQSPSQLRVKLQGCAWLVRLLPELAGDPIEPLPAWNLPPDQERRLMFRAVARFLANVAGPAGTLLLLDDLHWAGPDALDLLTALVRSTPEAALRVVGAYRDTDVQPTAPFAVVLADLAHAGLATHRTLASLTAEEAAELFERLVGDTTAANSALRDQVVARAGGVPFFLVSYAHGLQRDGPDGTTQAIPWDLRQSIRQRVAGLPDAAQALLGVAAIVGRVAPRALLLAAAAEPEPATLAALDATCRSQLLEETETDAYRFVHDVIREVVEADLGLARRAALHSRVALALEQRTGMPPVETLAYHWVWAGEDERAVPYLEQAGDRAQLQRAHAAAEGYYRQLLERLDGLGRVLDAARAREKMGAVLRVLARYDEALAVLERAAEAYREARDFEGEGRVTALIGYLHIDLGMPEQGIRRIQALVEQLATGGPSPALGALHMALTDLFWHSGRYSEELEAAEQAAVVGRALHDNRLLAAAQGARGAALETMGHIEEGLRELQEALRLAESFGELGSPSDIEMLRHAGSAFSYNGQLTDGLRYLDRAHSVSQRLGDPLYILRTLSHRAMCRICTGEWEAARRDLEQVAAMQRQLGISSMTTAALWGLGNLHRLQGAWDQATSELEEAIARAEGGNDLMHLLLCHGDLAVIEICKGQPSAACTRLVPLLDLEGMSRQQMHAILPRLAWSKLELGEMGAAEALVGEVVDYARDARELVLLADVLWLQALVAGRQERWQDAKAAVEEGLSLTRSLPYPYVEACTLQVYGGLHRQKGEPNHAREKLEVALAIFRRLGARKDIEQVERDLADLGCVP